MREEKLKTTNFLDWEDEMDINNVSVPPEFILKSTYTLRGVKGDDEEFSFEIPEMSLFNFKDDDNNELSLACSFSLYEKHDIDEENNLLQIFLKGEPYANPTAGVYIASLDFPTDLIKGD